MRALLINPWEKTIEEVEVATHKSGEPHLDCMYGLLSGPTARVDCFCIGATFQNGDALYVDDTGYWKNDIPLFDIGRLDGYLLAGNGLLLGTNGRGESVDVKMPINQLRELVQWTDHKTQVN